MARNDRFTDKVVFITGAASGIGRAAALAFAAEGARVAILDRSTEELEKVQSSVESAGGEVLTVVCDVSSPDHVEDAIEQVVTGSADWTSRSTMPAGRTRQLQYTKSILPSGIASSTSICAAPLSV